MTARFEASGLSILSYGGVPVEVTVDTEKGPVGLQELVGKRDLLPSFTQLLTAERLPPVLRFKVRAKGDYGVRNVRAWPREEEIIPELMLRYPSATIDEIRTILEKSYAQLARVREPVSPFTKIEISGDMECTLEEREEKRERRRRVPKGETWVWEKEEVVERLPYLTCLPKGR